MKILYMSDARPSSVVEDHFSIDAMGRNHLRYYRDVLSGKVGRG